MAMALVHYYLLEGVIFGEPFSELDVGTVALCGCEDLIFWQVFYFFIYFSFFLAVCILDV
jgi:hypothetical protein